MTNKKMCGNISKWGKFVKIEGKIYLLGGNDKVKEKKGIFYFSGHLFCVRFFLRFNKYAGLMNQK